MIGKDHRNLIERLFTDCSGLSIEENNDEQYVAKENLKSILKLELKVNDVKAHAICDQAESLGFIEEGTLVTQLFRKSKWVKGPHGTYKNKL